MLYVYTVHIKMDAIGEKIGVKTRERGKTVQDNNRMQYNTKRNTIRKIL